MHKHPYGDGGGRGVVGGGVVGEWGGAGMGGGGVVGGGQGGIGISLQMQGARGLLQFPVAAVNKLTRPKKLAQPAGYDDDVVV